MRILIVGAGATGGFYGGKLTHAGRDVTFLVRERRARQLQEHGLQILSPSESLTVHPKLIITSQLQQESRPFDLIILSTKAYQLEAAMEDIAPAVGPDTMLLPILNGMRQFDILRERFGAQHVLGGSCRIVSDLDAEGRIVNLSDLDHLNYGELSKERTPRIEAVHAQLSGAGFTAVLEPDILAALWQKWWILASMGTICVLSRGTIGDAAAVSRGADLERAVVHETSSIAAANGYPPNPKMLASQLKRLTEPGSTLTSSMYRDMMKGAPVEVDHILGDLLDRSKDASAPLITAAYVQLKVYEASRRR